MTKLSTANEQRSPSSAPPPFQRFEPVAPPEPPPRRRRSTLLVIIVIVLVSLAGIWWFNHRPSAQTSPGARPERGGQTGRNAYASGPNAPLPVAINVVGKGDLNLYLNALGTVTPLHNVTVRTQITGQLMEIRFQEGQLVHRGDLLAVVDPRPHEVALEQAQAQLRQVQSQLNTAQLDLERYETLAKQDSIAKQQVDTTRSQVSQFEGAVQVAQAAIDTAKLNLTYCHITAPVDGRVGLRLVDAGNYVTPGDTNGIVVLTQVKPITVIFTLPEDNISQITARLHTGAKLAVDAFDRTQSRQLASGTLITIDNQIDTTTGTVKLRAEFSNDDESLFPNQFVNVRLLVDTVRGVTVVPTSAIERGQQGSFVYLVQPDNTAVVRAVTLGDSEGERVAVTDGLAPGDRVVTDGADKLRDGQRVVISGSESGAGLRSASHPSKSGAGTGRKPKRTAPEDGAPAK